MKITFICICVWFCTVITSRAGQTPFSDRVNSLWLAGKKNDVLAIANQRLGKNSNDIVGLLLKMQYQLAYFDVNGFSSSTQSVISEGTAISSPNFAKAFPEFKTGLLFMQQNMPSFTPQEAAAEKTKGDIAGKSMEFIDILKAAELDGLTR